mgnify:CR=1 FL=1
MGLLYRACMANVLGIGGKFRRLVNGGGEYDNIYIGPYVSLSVCPVQEDDNRMQKLWKGIARKLPIRERETRRRMVTFCK